VSEHPGALLSAFADGAVTPEERQQVGEHLAGCEQCRRELDSIRAMRDAFAGLPFIEPPSWFLPGVLARGPQPRELRTRRFRFGVANVAATAAVWLVVVGATTHPAVPAASPDLAGLLAAHRAAADEPLDAAPGAEMSVPLRLGSGYTLAGFRRVEGVTQAVYRAGDRWLSLFAEPGGLDPSAVPAGAEQLVLSGDPAWEVDQASAQVVVVDRGDATLVLVGGPGTETLAVPDGLAVGHPDDGLLDRVVEAGSGLLRSFSLGG